MMMMMIMIIMMNDDNERLGFMIIIRITKYIIIYHNIKHEQ